MSISAVLEKIVADNVEVINLGNFLASSGAQQDLTNLQAAVANLGFTFPGLTTGVVAVLEAKYVGNGVAALEAWNAILISSIKFTDPAYVAPVPAA